MGDKFSRMARLVLKLSFTGHCADIGLDPTRTLGLGCSFPAIWKRSMKM